MNMASTDGNMAVRVLIGFLFLYFFSVYNMNLQQGGTFTDSKQLVSCSLMFNCASI